LTGKSGTHSVRAANALANSTKLFYGCEKEISYGYVFGLFYFPNSFGEGVSAGEK
jgi:hypothetical protein